MSRNDEFRESALYHGSQHPFEIGDVVVPNGMTHAYATDYLPSARVYSKFSNVYTVKPVDPKEVKTHAHYLEGHNNYASEKGFVVTGKLSTP